MRKTLSFDVTKLVNAVRVDRYEEIVKKHLEELRKSGVNVRNKFPKFWPKTTYRISTSSVFEVLPNTLLSFGEAEFVLSIDKD